MPADPAPLYTVAADLEERAALLRTRALLVGVSPEQVRWSSVGARAWADGVAEIRTLLLRSADEVDEVVSTFRAQAAQVGR